ncbi:MAG: YcaQ family DNA glycosylase [Rhodoferax sp.]|nr:YcaQ family DNA glycosylase [Rhodoferax sp.]
MAGARAPVLPLQQARNLQLAAQGLLRPAARAATPAAVRRCIGRMELLQIDTIHVVARSPYLVLFSRLGDYPMAWLDQALAAGHVFETWAHEACFAPTAQLALHRSHNRATRQHWGVALGRTGDPQQQEHLARLLAHVRSSGPVRSADFTRTDGRSGGWWGWKDEKLWLEALFARGDLMVARRERFQRVYDLAERVHPGIDALALPDATAVRDAFIDASVRALGITQARWVHDYFRLKPRLRDADLDPWVDDGRLVRVAVDGWERPAYVHADHLPLLRQAQRGRLQATHTTVLSPFDPLVWDRERASAMFGFDYRIECYTPADKRVYGYFVLPLLHRGRLVGRLDAKAHREQGMFELKSLFLEPGVEVDDELLQALAGALWCCARWHGAQRLRLVRTSPPALGPRMRQALRTCEQENA